MNINKYFESEKPELMAINECLDILGQTKFEDLIRVFVPKIFLFNFLEFSQEIANEKLNGFQVNCLYLYFKSLAEINGFQVNSPYLYFKGLADMDPKGNNNNPELKHFADSLSSQLKTDKNHSKIIEKFWKDR